MKTEISIHMAANSHIPALHQIYCHNVREGTASWELSEPSVEEFERRMTHVQEQDLPYLVAERDGQPVGYAYASRFRPRAGYNYTVENSVYVHPDYNRQGIGSLLLARLIERCEALGFRQMIAVIGDAENVGSIKLHLKMGFVHIGTLSNIGYKHGRWLDCVLMQLSLGQGAKSPPEPTTGSHDYST